MWALGQGLELAPPFSYCVPRISIHCVQFYHPALTQKQLEIFFYNQAVNFEQFIAIWRVLYKRAWCVEVRTSHQRALNYIWLSHLCFFLDE